MPLPERVQCWRTESRRVLRSGFRGRFGSTREVKVLIPDTLEESHLASLTINTAMIGVGGGLAPDVAKRIKKVSGKSGLDEFQGQPDDIDQLITAVS